MSPSAISRLFAGRYGTRGTAASLATREGLLRIELALRLLASDGARPKAKKALSASRRPRALAIDTAIRRAAKAEAEARQHASATERWLAPFRILIAEDEADILELYQMVLTDDENLTPEGEPRYTIIATRTVEACLEALRVAVASGAVIDLLLMDLGLGDPLRGTGEGALLAHLRAQPELLPRRILVVSGVSTYLLAQREADLAALHAAFLPKPFNIDTLAAAVAWLCTPGSPPMEGVRYFS